MMRMQSSGQAWAGAALGLAVAAAVAGSPQVRYWIAAAFERIRGAFVQGVEGIGSSLGRPTGKRMGGLEEMRGTADTATTQWESSMTVRKVADALAQEPRLRRRSVEVRIIGGILHLAGEVHDEEEKRLAGEVVRRASGAQLVANDLRVARPVR